MNTTIANNNSARLLSRRRFNNRNALNFGYDAVVNNGKRRMSAPILRSEDWELQPVNRKQLVASQRDLPRNFAVARWLIERHLDYTTDFTFKFRSKNLELNALVEAKIKDWSKRKNSDVAKRHPFNTAIRLAEASALTANDCLAIKLADGRVQWIEGDRINNPGMGLPPGINPLMLIHGVLVDDYTAAQAYCVCRRGPKGNMWQAPYTLQFQQMVSADDGILHGFYDRFDQVRGISPLSSALNSMQDIYESKTYALGRMKIDQLMALAVYRGNSDAITERPLDANGNPTGQDYTQLPIANGPAIVDMDVGDRMEFLQSSQPSTQFQEFMQKAIAFCLKALAIPYSFFDEAYTNYSGARQALLQYEQAAEHRRDTIRLLLDELTDWILQLFINDGELPEIDPVDYQWEWVSAGLPWIDPMKEAQANVLLIQNNLESEIHVLKQQGRDFADVIAERKIAMQLVQDAGLMAAVGAAKPQVADPADPDGDAADDTEDEKGDQ